MLPSAQSGLEYQLAYEGNLSLHYAAFYERIFQLHEPQETVEKAREDTRSKGWTTATRRFKLQERIYPDVNNFTPQMLHNTWVEVE